MQAEVLSVHEIRRPPVIGDLLRDLGHRKRELVEVVHGRHSRESATSVSFDSGPREENDRFPTAGGRGTNGYGSERERRVVGTDGRRRRRDASGRPYAGGGE